MVHKGWGGVFLPHLSKIRNNGPKSITIGRKVENHVKFHEITLHFTKHEFMLTSAFLCPICTFLAKISSLENI